MLDSELGAPTLLTKRMGFVVTAFRQAFKTIVNPCGEVLRRTVVTAFVVYWLGTQQFSR